MHNYACKRPMLFSSLRLMITRARKKFQPNLICSLRKKWNKQRNSDDNEAKQYIDMAKK